MDDRDRTSRKHVIAVNSSPDFLLIVRELLADEGYAVTTSTFEPNLFTRIVMRHPDALIVDVAPGEAAGWDLLGRLYLEAKVSEIPCWSPPPVQRCWSRRAMRLPGTERTGTSWQSR